MISFSLHRLDYTAPQKIYTIYNGRVDEKWISSGTNHSATYTNLNPGKIYFKVKAAIRRGME